MNPRTSKPHGRDKAPPPSARKPAPRRTRQKYAGHGLPNEAVSAEERHQMIAEAAYFIAENQGFDGSDPVENWLQAESQIDEALRGTNMWTPDDLGTEEDVERG